MNAESRNVLLCTLTACLLLLYHAPDLSAQQGGAQMIALGDLGPSQTVDIYDLTLKTAIFQYGYRLRLKEETPLAEGLDRYQSLAREEADQKRTLMIGYRHYAAQPDRIILTGQLMAGDATPAENPDVRPLRADVEQLVADYGKSQKKYTALELEREVYQVSHMRPDMALKLLGDLGYETGPLKGATELSQLPRIFQIADAAPPRVVGGNVSSRLEDATESAAQNRLLILYHRSQGAQVYELRKTLEEIVDVPARSVLIEALFIELSESSLRELGIQYNWTEETSLGEDEFEASFLEESVAGQSVFPFRLTATEWFNKTGRDPRKLRIQLKALIDEGSAEILSSPSVLTLDNRQALISVVQEVPVLTSVITESTTSVKVTYKTVGITLNIKPRTSQDGHIVAMQVLAEVSEAPKEEFIEAQGQPVVPVVFKRLVQTIAEVKEDTPFIIGGLIRNEDVYNVSRVPLLSAIPILGNLFKVTNRDKEKREVIIVVTPRVIEAHEKNRPVLPKDSERFNFTDNRLFRNSYRLKAEDVFDLDFILKNEKLLAAFDRARTFVESYPEFKGRPPFDRLEKRTFPGEEAIVVRMLYEIVKDELALHEQIAPGDLIFFKRDPTKPAGFKVRWLKKELEKLTDDGDMDSFFVQDYPKKIVALRYDLDPGKDLDALLSTPVADWSVEEVADRDEMEQLFYDYNRLGEDELTRKQAVIVLDTKDDLDRLRTAVVVREIINVNSAILELHRFQVGRKIVIPQIRRENERVFLIDHLVATYFYMSDFYYEAFQNMLRNYYDGIQNVLQQQGE